VAGETRIMSKLSVNELTDETGTGAPSFPNGMSVTGAALTDPEITGGIFLGGTGSANKLDDYEEGTFTPTAEDQSGNSISLSASSGSYVKIGRLVTITLRVDVSSTSGANASEDFRILSMPFVANSGTERASGSVQFNTTPFLTSKPSVSFVVANINDGNSFIDFRGSNDNAGIPALEVQDFDSNSDVICTITYETND